MKGKQKSLAGEVGVQITARGRCASRSGAGIPASNLSGRWCKHTLSPRQNQAFEDPRRQRLPVSRNKVRFRRTSCSGDLDNSQLHRRCAIVFILPLHDRLRILRFRKDMRVVHVEEEARKNTRQVPEVGLPFGLEYVEVDRDCVIDTGTELIEWTRGLRKVRKLLRVAQKTSREEKPAR